MNIRDFVITKNTKCYIDPANNLGLKEGDCIDNLTTLTMTISGKMKVVQLDQHKALGILLPSKDFIYIPADDHPYVKVSQRDYPVFASENIIDWNDELVDGEFYILFKNGTDGQLILISKIHADTIEYEIITSRMNRNSNMYYPELVHVTVNMEEARKLTFIPLTDINEGDIEDV
jgi:hypothetical protein